MARCLIGTLFCWSFALTATTLSQTRSPATFLRITSQECPARQSLRGLSVVDDQIAWASGAGGAVLRTIDGGRTWQAVDVPNAAAFEFRDIHAFDAMQAVVISAAAPAVVYRTRDGGVSWSEVYRDEREDVFFNAMSFWDDQRGLAFSDPIDQKFVLIRTEDGGVTWQPLPAMHCPEALANEAGFAASGTSLFVRGENSAWIGLGGLPAEGQTATARVLITQDRGATWSVGRTDLPRSASAGVFSLLMLDDRLGVAVGGDYQEPGRAVGNAARTEDGGKTWKQVAAPPSGYRSAVALATVNDQAMLVATGTNGTDVSLDQGRTWIRASDQGFNAAAFAPASSLGWAVGDGGRVARMSCVNDTSGQPR